MAKKPLVQLSDIALTFGGDPVLDGLDINIHQGDRIALVGRNGSGKSTLLKVMAGLIEPDDGVRICAPGIHVGYMEQDPDLTGYETLGDFAASRLEPGQEYRVEVAAEGLGFDASMNVVTASGGEKRRAALACLLAQSPDLMLLDEPTNHLDIQAIEWLERQLRDTSSAYVLISHDRRFLTQLSRATVWVDRGVVRRQEKGFADFEAWRDKSWAEEDDARHKLNRKIKSEARWAVEGISARRKRNQGRVRALAALRAERAGQITRTGKVAMAFESGQKSGRKVIEAREITKSFGDQEIVRNFSLQVARGDRIALVGPNGVGKTTLLKMLIGQLAPDSGDVVLGTNLTLAVFDQNRDKLNPDLSLWENLTSDPEMGVSGKSDQILVRGVARHVVGYLKEFLFDDTQVRTPVRALSGGEKARLVLAKLMARNSNLLVLDEPTNDLDVETLDLLQDVLAEYEGTVILVSHDRDFIDRVATATIAMEGQGRATAYPGGWSDYEKQRPEPEIAKKAAGKKATRAASRKSAKPDESQLTFTESHRLDALPDEIARFEAEIAKLEDYLAAPDLFNREPLKFKKATQALQERQTALSAAEEEWLTLAEKSDS